MKTIAIDFDGVIHKYSKGWKDGSIYDEPFDNVFKIIKKIMDLDYSVFVFSTRSPKQIKRWLKAYLVTEEMISYGFCNETYYKYYPYGFDCKIIPFWKKFWDKPNVLGITQRKLPAVIYIDDRALKFDGDWEKTFTSILTS